MITRRRMLFGSMVAAIGCVLPWTPRVLLFEWTLQYSRDAFGERDGFINIRRWTDGDVTISEHGIEWARDENWSSAGKRWTLQHGIRTSNIVMRFPYEDIPDIIHLEVYQPRHANDTVIASIG